MSARSFMLSISLVAMALCSAIPTHATLGSCWARTDAVVRPDMNLGIQDVPINQLTFGCTTFASPQTLDNTTSAPADCSPAGGPHPSIGSTRTCTWFTFELGANGQTITKPYPIWLNGDCGAVVLRTVTQTGRIPAQWISFTGRGESEDAARSNALAACNAFANDRHQYASMGACEVKIGECVSGTTQQGHSLQ